MSKKRPRLEGTQGSHRAQPTSKESRTKDSLGKALIKARTAKGLSQIDLARASGVSPRTIAKIEREGGARFDAVIRLARALAEPAENWLALAGREVSQEKIRSVLTHDRRAPESHFEHLERTPVQFFEDVIAQLKDRGAPALLCACVTTRPATLVNPAVRQKFQELLDAGVTLAVCSPYPHPSAIPRRHYTERTALVALYTQVFGWTRELGAQLGAAAPGKSNQVRVFFPRCCVASDESSTDHPAHPAYLVPPPLGLVDYRPALVKYARSAAGQPEKLELGTYVRYGRGRPDQWMMLYPREGDEEDQARSNEALETWRDYFSDILRAWNATAERIHWDDDKLLDWQPLREEP